MLNATFYSEAVTGCALKKSFLQNFTIFTGKYLFWADGLSALLKRDSNAGVFLTVDITKFLRTPFLKSIRERLLLFIQRLSFRF